MFLKVKWLLIFCISITGLFEIHRFIDIHKQNNSTITVYGLSDRIIESDHVIVNIKLTEFGDNIVQIGQNVNKKIADIKNILIQQGFKETEISETGLEVWYDRWSKKKRSSNFSNSNWSDGESSYKKRLRLIVTSTYDKE